MSEEKKKPNRARAKQVIIRMSDEEYEKVMANVELSDMSKQDYFINALTKKKIVVRERADDELVKSVSKQILQTNAKLSQLGNNVNQIAKKLNEQGFVDYKKELYPTFDEVKKMMEEVNKLCQSLKQ